MDKLLKPSKYNASLMIPSSKSYMQRAVALAILSQGETALKNPDFSNDSSSALKIAETLGCKVVREDSLVKITPKNPLKAKQISVGEAGLGLRLFTPVCALLGGGLTIQGEGSLLKRPMSMMEKPMADLGAKISLSNGFVPITIHSGLKGGFAEIDGSQSSQFLTGLLTALPKAEKDSVLKVENLKSVPYVQMTLDIIEKFGGQIQNIDFKEFRIKGKQKYTATEYQVEGDWSSAAAHLIAGAIAGKAVVKGLNPNSLQADRAVMKVLEQVGAEIVISNDEIKVSKKDLRAYNFDATDCPDLFPVLASLAANCSGESVIKGVSRLAHKESDRALAIKEEFFKIGIQVDLEGDFMKLKGGKISGGVTVSSRNDHRMAFSLAVATLNADKQIVITDAQSVKKSYPRFWEDFEKSVEI